LTTLAVTPFCNLIYICSGKRSSNLKTIKIVLLSIFISFLAGASDVTYENLAGRYIVDGSWLIYKRSFNLTLTADRQISVQLIRADAGARICTGTYEITRDDTNGSMDTILKSKATCPKDTNEYTFDINIYDAKTQDFERPDGARIELDSSFIPVVIGTRPKPTGTMRKVSQPN
jgi:hypothetical protein